MADRVIDYTKKMFGCPLYILNTKKACFVRLMGYPYALIHLDAPCMFDAPCVWMLLMFGWLPVSLDAPICLPVWLDTPIHFGAPYVWMPHVCLDAPICLDDVWMPPVQTQHKESLLCQTRGVHMHPYIWMALYINNTNKACFVRLRGVHMPPIHLDNPCMFRCCHMFGHPHMFGCPCMFGCPLCLDTPLYGQMPPTCLNTPCMFGCPPYVWL